MFEGEVSGKDLNKDHKGDKQKEGANWVRDASRDDGVRLCVSDEELAANLRPLGRSDDGTKN